MRYNEYMTKHSPVGKTQDAGWEIGTRQTFAISQEEAWEILVSPEGLHCWFGHDPDLTLKKGASFKTSEGTTGYIVSFHEGEMIRLRWRPKEWDFDSTLQVRVLTTKGQATISFHHEKLQSAEQREEMRAHWLEALAKLSKLLAV